MSEHAETILRARVDALLVERQQLQTERDGYLARVDEVNVERQRQEVRAILAESEAQQLRDALERIADPPLGATTTQWLVEGRGGEGPGSFAWWLTFAWWLRGDGQWVTDAYDAAMFPTRETAEQYIAEKNVPDVIAVEHGFMSLSMDVPEEVREFARAALVAVDKEAQT
jgi:hypothetical protein